ncbi:NUDIX domain-containing protein [Salinibacter ruber]|uniref:NUDIX domain-containing protein n=1 Tax=Salinibacter ruber TaxID=146919 RepID=UPI002169D85F|nr:NUDIX domain-containing protein [Salinibacter ruber]MCS3648574.1 8-oxo-dGTP pyrophosphatase MutT (NUDIX family) [Salinibacter ruber]
MVRLLRRVGAWVVYRVIRAYWWIRKPIVLGVRVLIFDKDRVLLVRHSYREGWFLPGGTPESGESLTATARREAKEETGLVIQDLSLFGMYSELGSPASDHVAVFVASVPTNSVSDANFSAEIKEVRWVSSDKKPVSMIDQTEQIIRDWKDGLMGQYRVLDY